MNPDIGKPLPTTRPKPIIGSTTRVSGSDLLPPALQAGAHGIAGVEPAYKYWVGVTPSCPREWIDCAGINFPKVNEELVPDPQRSGYYSRRPVIGSIVTMDAKRVQLLVEKLRNLVLRPIGPSEDQSTLAEKDRPRNCRVLKIPTQADIDTARREGRATHPYVPQAGDEPAARYLFAVLCDDQEHGNRGDFYPETLETAGIEFPDSEAIHAPVAELVQQPKRRGRPPKARPVEATAPVEAPDEIPNDLTQ